MQTVYALVKLLRLRSYYTPSCMLFNMMKNDGKTRGQKAESMRMTAQGRMEAKARLKFIQEMKDANPGIRFKIPTKQESELKQFMKDTRPRPKMGSAKKSPPKKAGSKSKKSTPRMMEPLFNPKKK